MHRTEDGAKIECTLPGPLVWYVVEEYKDARGNMDGFDGKVYCLQTSSDGRILTVHAIRRTGGNYKIIIYG